MAASYFTPWHPAAKGSRLPSPPSPPSRSTLTGTGTFPKQQRIWQQAKWKKIERRLNSLLLADLAQNLARVMLQSRMQTPRSLSNAPPRRITGDTISASSIRSTRFTAKDVLKPASPETMSNRHTNARKNAPLDARDVVTVPLSVLVVRL